MARVLYIRLNAAEAAERAPRLEALGHVVEVVSDQTRISDRLREEPPDALVFDLDRIPSVGKYIGVFLRRRKSTRTVPLVYVGGKPEKIETVRSKIPDAVFTDWDHLGQELERSLNAPRRNVVVPTDDDLFGARSLHQKLGLKPGMAIALIGFPPNYDLGPLPEGAKLRRRAQGKLDLAILFAADEGSLARHLDRAGPLIDAGCAIWISWEKGAGLTLPSIRAAANARDLTDFKLCKLPGGLSSSRFSRRRS